MFRASTLRQGASVSELQRFVFYNALCFITLRPLLETSACAPTGLAGTSPAITDRGGFSRLRGAVSAQTEPLFRCVALERMGTSKRPIHLSAKKRADGRVGVISRLGTI